MLERGRERLEETEKATGRDGERVRKRKRERERKSEREKEIERDRQRETERDRQREIERKTRSDQERASERASERMCVRLCVCVCDRENGCVEKYAQNVCSLARTHANMHQRSLIYMFVWRCIPYTCMNDCMFE